MKNKFLPLLLLSVLSFASCRVDVKADNGINGLSFNSVKASDNIVTEIRDVKSFESITVTSAIKVIISDDKFDNKITIKGPDNVIKILKSEVINGQLKLSFSEPVNFRSQDLVVTIPHQKLRSIDVSGASKVTANHKMMVEKFTAKLSGASSATLNIVSNEVNLDLSGASSLTIGGNAQKLFIDNSGASKLSAKELKAAFVRVDCSGASKAEVWAIDELEADASGASKVTYVNENNLKKNVSNSGASSVKSI